MVSTTRTSRLVISLPMKFLTNANLPTSHTTEFQWVGDFNPKIRCTLPPTPCARVTLIRMSMERSPCFWLVVYWLMTGYSMLFSRWFIKWFINLVVNRCFGWCFINQPINPSKQWSAFYRYLFAYCWLSLSFICCPIIKHQLLLSIIINHLSLQSKWSTNTIITITNGPLIILINKR